MLENRWVPSTLTVINTNDSGAGSLRAAIAAAHNGDTINVAPSLDGQTITLTTGELLIKQNLTIAGPGAGQLTVSGNNASRVFEVAKKAIVALNGLTISNGYVVSMQAKSGYGTTDGEGAGILNQGTLTVSNSTLSHNTAALGTDANFWAGGGIDSYGTLTVSNSTFSYNTAGGGGGLYNERGGTLAVSSSILSYNTAVLEGGGIGSESTATINGCQLLNNTAAEGGGIANWATMTVTGCTIFGNVAAGAYDGFYQGEGGGIYATDTAYTANNLTITGSSLSGNSATAEGGGIYVENGTVKVLNGTTLSGNSAGTYGGGIYVYYANVTVSGSTLANNYASTTGGGIYIEPRFQPPVTISGSTFTGNTSGPLNTTDNIFGVWTDEGGNTFV
jgi:predicted outer membrane repeat protein